jgi:hypothetical protein
MISFNPEEQNALIEAMRKYLNEEKPSISEKVLIKELYDRIKVARLKSEEELSGGG